MVGRIHILGAGSILPTATRSYSGLLVDVDAEALLFDCGPCTVWRLTRELNREISAITHLFLTHFHVDHTSDFVVLMKTRALNSRLEPLKVYGPSGLLKFKSDLLEGVEEWSYLTKDLHCQQRVEFVEIKKGDVAQSSNWTISCTPVSHSRGVAYRLDCKDGSLAYSGDTVPDQNLISLAKGVDVLIHECSFPDRKSLVGLHTSASDLGFVAEATGCRTLVVTHMYPECEGREQEMIDHIREVFKGEVIVATDLLRIDFQK